MDPNQRDRDLVLAHNEFAFISDETKGHIVTYVGPHKTSLATSDRPVVFDAGKNKFTPATLDAAKSNFPSAEEGSYIVLSNPATDGKNPKPGVCTLGELDTGRKINIPGPVSFPLWPGQKAEIIAGHHLRSNQYLVVRVYNEEAAVKNWDKAIIKKTDPNDPDAASAENAKKPSDLTTGKVLVIKGTEVSFFIPPTGIEVLKDEDDEYVRDAVSLEQLEYCILLDEDGNKDYIKGPAVVFPTPTQTFVAADEKRKFLAIELDERSGLYIKVIAAYEADGKKYEEGEELFLTGKDTKLYFPQPEHAIVKSGNNQVHHAVAIPKGEARYVLNKDTGAVDLRRGPCMFLPDPRKEVIVRRALPADKVDLMFPGNKEAKRYNEQLMAMTGDHQKPVSDEDFTSRYDNSSRSQTRNALYGSRNALESLEKVVSASAGAAPKGVFVGDQFQQDVNTPKPESIVLNSKYEGAIAVTPYVGYAVLVTSKDGQRKVIQGPQTYLLEYDESLEEMQLSKGKPKNTDSLERTVYLRTLNNKVSDIVEVESKDMCKIDVKLSYRVNFEGSPELWFNVENYVKFLCDNLRSRLKNKAKGLGVELFYGDYANIVRDTLLGVQADGTERTGRRFLENGMRVYDVEILGVIIKDPTIAALLTNANVESVKTALTLAAEERILNAVVRQEAIKKEKASALSETKHHELELEVTGLLKTLEVKKAEVETASKVQQLRLQAEIDTQTSHDAIESAKRNRDLLNEKQKIDLSTARQNLDIEKIREEVIATVKKSEAISPGLIAAINAAGDKDLAARLATAVSPMSLIKNTGVLDVMKTLFKGTAVEDVLNDAQHVIPAEVPTTRKA